MRAKMPKKSSARAIHCAQHQYLTMNPRQRAREIGTADDIALSSAHAQPSIIKHQYARSGGWFCQETEQRPLSRRHRGTGNQLQTHAKWRAHFSGTRIAGIRARVRLNDETTRFPTLNSSVPGLPRGLRGVARRCSRLIDEVC
jgi:hypothetical protein